MFVVVMLIKSTEDSIVFVVVTCSVLSLHEDEDVVFVLCVVHRGCSLSSA